MALDHSRSFYFDNNLALEKTISLENFDKLEKLGHKVTYCDLPHGGGQAIFLRDNGVLVGGFRSKKRWISFGILITLNQHNNYFQQQNILIMQIWY